MTIWSSQLRHNFFNHALFSCVKQEIDRIKGCILRNVAFCVGTSTAVLAVVLHWVQKLWLPWFEPLYSPPRKTGKQDDFLGCPCWVRFPFGKHESWGRQLGRWTRHRKPRIYNPRLLAIKLALSGLWLLAPGHGHFHPLLHSWSLWKSSKQNPHFIPHPWSSQRI